MAVVNYTLKASLRVGMDLSETYVQRGTRFCDWMSMACQLLVPCSNAILILFPSLTVISKRKY